MDRTNNERYNNILGIIAIVKFTILLFILMIETSKVLDVKNYNQIFSNGYVFIVPVALVIIFILWSFMYTIKFNTRVDIIQIIEDLIYISVLCGLILISDKFDSDYKYLFLFSIISATIALGKRYGLIISIISSFIICFIDIHFAPANTKINEFFENDLLLSFGFITIAWVIGEYKKFENDQRELLEQELLEKMKQHDYIEDMLLKNEDCYNILIKYSHYAIVVHDGDKILFINEKALQLFGAETLHELGTSSMSVLHGIENISHLRERYLDIIANQKSNVTFEETIINKKAQRIEIENLSTYCTYGKEKAILTIMRDITPEKQVTVLQQEVKETQEQNKFITEFFSNISHELKTPLNIINSSLQLFHSYNGEEFMINKEKYLSVMKLNCYRLIKLVNNLLDIIKYDSGFTMLNLKNKDIVYVVESIAMSIVPYAENRGIELIFDTDTEERYMAVDEDKIERILLNLLSNALKFTDKGGNIYVDLFDKGNSIEIRVKDTGIGIPEDKIDYVFGRFSQVDKTLQRNHEGTGIGLSLVKSFVELHGGEIQLQSELGCGSEFIITLPAEEIDINKIDMEIKDNITERVNMELSDIYMDDLPNN